jgi:hypothetical protein
VVKAVAIAFVVAVTSVLSVLSVVKAVAVACCPFFMSHTTKHLLHNLLDKIDLWRYNNQYNYNTINSMECVVRVSDDHVIVLLPLSKDI